MMFSKDQFYGQAVNGSVADSFQKPFYEAGKEYEVEEHMVPRWLKRGGVIVGDLDSRATEGSEPAKVQEKTPASEVENQEPVEAKEEKAEDVSKPEPHHGKSTKAHGQKHGPKHGGHKR